MKIYIKAPEIFGGEDREGGIEGCADWLNGEPTQTTNEYLINNVGTPIPAFRGVSSLVLNQAYVSAFNPYLKNWEFWGTRIQTRQNGLAQWYPEKAVIGSGCESMFEEPTDEPTPYYNFISRREGSVDAAQRPTYFATAFTSEPFGPDALTINRDYRFFVDFKNSTFLVTDLTAGSTWFSGTDVRFQRYLLKRLEFVRDGDPSNLSIAVHSNFVINGTPFTWTTSDVTLSGATSNPASHFVIGNGTMSSTSAVADPGTTATATIPLPGVVPVDTLSFDVRVTTGDFRDPLRVRFSGFGVEDRITKDGDLNPAHIIRECLTDPDWGMGYAESDIDDVSFAAAADTLYSEGMGISILWDRENTLEAFVQDIVRHIDAALYVDRSTGKFVLKLIRDDYDPEAIITLGPSEIESVENYRRPAFGELINAVTVNYWSCETGKQASVGVQEIALVQTQGGTIGTTIEYPGFTNPRNALRAAQRDLRALSLPLLSCTVYANRAAASLDIGETFKLEWPDYHTGAVVMRVTGMAFGDGRTDRIRIECVEDVFSSPEDPVISEPENLWINPTRPPDPVDGGDPQDPPPEEPPPPPGPDDSDYVPPGSDDLGPVPPIPPEPPTTHGQALVTEAPFYLLARSLGDVEARAILTEDNGAGFLATAAGKPGGAQRYQIWVDRGDGFVQTRNAEFAPFANLRSTIGFTDTTIALKNRRDFNRSVSGRFGQIGDEIIVFESTSAQSMIVRRGALDTVPQQHPVNTPVWIWQDWAGSDGVQYTSNELINVKLISINGSGRTRSETVPQFLRFRSRAHRPYPPGNLKVNGDAYPELVFALDEPFTLTVTWSHRDRLQQTAAVIEDTTYGSIGPEDGTTYSIGIFDSTDNALDFESGITATSWDWVAPNEFPEGSYTLKLWSVRDGYASWQRHVISFVVQPDPFSINYPLTFDCSSDQPVLDDPIEFVCEV
jgi:hypothetical protein